MAGYVIYNNGSVADIFVWDTPWNPLCVVIITLLTSVRRTRTSREERRTNTEDDACNAGNVSNEDQVADKWMNGIRASKVVPRGGKPNRAM